MPRLVKPGDPAWSETVSVAQMVFGSGVNLALIRHLAGRVEAGTRAQLADEMTGFSPATLSKAVSFLADAGVLEKTPTLAAATGRLSHAFSLNAERVDELLDSLRRYALGAKA